MAKYIKQITLGYDKEGNRIRKRAYGNTKAELEQAINKLKQTYLEETSLNYITFEKYSIIWLETYKKNTSPRTYEMYSQLLKKCVDLEKLRIVDIRRSDLQNIMNTLSDRPNTHNKVLMCLNQIFKSAILDEIIIKNPAAGLQKQKNIVKEKRALTAHEKECLKTIDFNPKEKFFITILLHFGLRPGEALALTKESFDLANKKLIIDKAITFVSNHPILKGTKTGVVRELPIPDSLMPYIKEYLAQSENIIFNMRGNIAYMTKTAYYSFGNNIFNKINQSLGGNANKNCLNGMTFYTFRHNKATALYYVEGLSLKAKAEYMGHSINMLLKIYSHIDKDRENSEKYNVF